MDDGKLISESPDGVAPTLPLSCNPRAGAGGAARRASLRTLATAAFLALTVVGVLLPVQPARAQSPPQVTDIGYISAPLNGDTFAAGESITVYVLFDKRVISLDRSWLPITVGIHTRRAWNLFEPFEPGRVMAYRYIVRADDLDRDGISIAADALLSAAGVIKDVTDFTTDAVLTHRELSADSSRQVSGTPFTPGVLVSPQDLAIAEGGTSSYSVVLASPPTAPVTITATRAAGGDEDLRVSPARLTFPVSNWSMAQTLRVSAAQDRDAVDGKATFAHTASSADARYDGLEIAALDAIERDDEAVDGAARLSHVVPYFSAASNPAHQGFVRIVNHDHEAGTVAIVATDDAGRRFRPATLSIKASEAIHFNSDDLEDGNAAKGLSNGVGSGVGDWWLEVDSTLDIEVLAYLRTADGFLTAMHDVVPREGNRFRLAIFNPGTNRNQVSLLRITNPSAEAATLRIAGIDDGGGSGEAQMGVPAGETVTLPAQELEALGLGDGEGKWQLLVESDVPVRVVNLLGSPTGHLTNLSTAPANVAIDDTGMLVHGVPLVPAAGGNFQGFVRVINHDDESGMVEIRALDDAGVHRGTLELELQARETAHFNSDDLRSGNAGKGLAGSVDDGEGHWRLELRSSLAIEVLSYARTRDGFLTSLHDLAPGAGHGHHVGVFNPGRNRNQVSSLRLVNPGDTPAAVNIVGVDDRGEVPGEGASTTVPAGGAVDYAVQELEEGAVTGLEGSIGVGKGKWRLRVSSEQPIRAMSLLTSPTGHLTNLSTSPGTQRDSDGDGIVDFVDVDDDNDGASDRVDAFPLDASEWADSDGDGIGDNADPDDGEASESVVLRGRVALEGALSGATIVVSAHHGIPMARGVTAAMGEFEIPVHSGSLPEIVLLTAYGGEHRGAGANDETVANYGRLRALVTKSRLLDASGAMVNLNPLTEIVYHEVRSRYPKSGPTPSEGELSSYLDEVAQRYVDIGEYAAILAFDEEADRASSKLDWGFVTMGLVAAIRAGAGDAEISSRVSGLALQFEDEGTREDPFELRRVAGTGDERVLTIARAGEAGDLRSVRQTFIDENGALVNARLTKVNDEKSRVSIDISYAGRTFSITGASRILGDVPFTREGLEEFASSIVTLSVRGRSVVIDIDKALSRAISDGELVFRVDGRTPRPDEVSVIRDDPMIAWNLGFDPGLILDAELEQVADVQVDGEQVLAWANEDFLLIRVPNEHYAKLAGLDEDVLTDAALDIATGILVAVAKSLAGGWVLATADLALTANSVVFFVENRHEIGEAAAASSRVALREVTDASNPGGAVSETIAPGRRYFLDLFFKANPCGKYSTREYGSDNLIARECPFIQLGINATDTFVYEHHRLGVESSSMTITCPEGYSPPTGSTKRCQRREEGGLTLPVAGFRQPEVPSTTQSLTPCREDRQLVCLPAPLVGFWIVPRQLVEFELVDWQPRPDEGLVYAYKSLELSDNIAMYSRNLRYNLDLGELELLPDFHTRIDRFHSALVLDATPTIVVPPAEKAYYRWTWRNPENGTSGLIGVDAVAPSDPVVRRVPLWTFETRGSSGAVDITLDLQVTGVRGTDGRTTLSKAIVRSVQVADESDGLSEDEPLPTFEGVSIGNRNLTQRVQMEDWELPEVAGGVRPLDYVLASPLPPGLSFSPATRLLTGTPREAGIWSMRYIATDTYGGNASLEFQIRVQAKDNVAPDADAGPDKTVRAGDLVSLSGAGSSDPDGDVVRYSWTQTAGPRVQLSPVHAIDTSFTAPRVSTQTMLEFRLFVADRDGGTDEDSVTITVLPAGTGNSPPMANAGLDQSVVAGARVSLSGARSSDPDGRVVRYAWSQTGGTRVQLSGTSSVNASFTAPQVSTETTLVFRLTVTDDDDATDDDTVNVTVRPSATGTGVHIPDANLRRAIEVELGKSAGEAITRNEMATITSLNLHRRGVQRLTGLEHATKLSSLLFEYNSVSDLSPLAGLASLETLWAGENSISNLSPLSSLTKLTFLSLTRNSVSNLSALSGLHSLRTLWIEENSISDISALSGLTGLKSLALGRNSIRDISALSRMTNLTQLEMTSNSISNLSALSGLTNLEGLALRNNSISDLSPLSGLNNLESLGLENNSISNLSALSGLIGLDRLRLSHNSLSDISALSTLTSLVNLDLDSNSISDISPLVQNQGLGRATSVNLEENPLSSTSINVHIPALQARGVRVNW